MSSNKAELPSKVVKKEPTKQVKSTTKSSVTSTKKHSSTDTNSILKSTPSKRGGTTDQTGTGEKVKFAEPIAPQATGPPPVDGGTKKPEKKNPKDYFGIDPKTMPDGTVIPTPDNVKWECFNKKWYKVPAYGSFDDIHADDSLMIIDPINVIPGEKCTCGRPKTELEKIGIYTYGDFLKKCTIKGRTVNPYGKNLKFSDSKPGLAIVIRSYEKTSDNMIPVRFKKRSEQRVGDVLIRF